MRTRLDFPADFIAIVGGCGKSTLLRQRAGLDTLFGGAIGPAARARAYPGELSGGNPRLRQFLSDIRTPFLQAA